MNYNDFYNIETHLEKFGYVVINLLNDKEVNNLSTSFHKWLYSLSPEINNTSWDTMPDQIHGIIKSYGIGQSKMMWKLRRNVKIKRIYQYLYNVPKNTRMICSYDGVCYHPKELAVYKKSVELWPHIDINPSRPYKTFQSLITLEDNTSENDGSFVIYPKSHKFNFDFIKNDDDFNRISPSYLHSFKPRNIRVPKGHMIIWNSLTVHCNIPPTKSNTDLSMSIVHDRLVAYVCMVPQKMVSRKTLQKLYEWKDTNRTTGHCPINPRVNTDEVIYNKTTKILILP